MPVTIIRDCNTAGWAPIYDCRDEKRVFVPCRATAVDGSLQPVPAHQYRAYVHMVLPGEPPDDDSILAMIDPATNEQATVLVCIPYTSGRDPRYGIFIAVYGSHKDAAVDCVLPSGCDLDA